MKDDISAGRNLNISRWPLTAIFCLHVTFSVIYAFVIPLRRGPDEESHYRYIQHLISFRSLPRITRPGDPDGTRDERTGAIAIHPPLYYFCALPVYAVSSPFGDEIRQRALRFLATAFGLATLLVTLRIQKLLFPYDRAAIHLATQIGIVGFVAFLPHFLLLSSVINNDGLFIFLNTLLVWFMVRTICIEVATTRDLIVIGIVFGLCLLTKGSAVAMIPLMPIFALMHSREDREYSFSKLIRNCLCVFVPAALVAGWWFVWYASVHGRMYLIPKAGGPPIRYDSVSELLESGNAGVLVWRYLEGIAKSIWSQVDWILPNDPQHPEQATSAAYPISGVIWIVMMVYLLFPAVVNPIAMALAAAKKRFSKQMRAMLFAYAHFGCYFAALMYSTLFIHPGGFQGGRYLLPSVCGLALFSHSQWPLLLSLGVPLDRLRRKPAYLFCGFLIPIVLIIWNITCIINLSNFLVPVYAVRTSTLS